MLIDIYRSAPFPGYGWIGGEPPATSLDPDSPDGRTRVLGALARVTVEVFERESRTRLRATLSTDAGTWRVGALPLDVPYYVVFFNEQGYTVTVGAEQLPVNSFIQDFVYPVPHSGD